MNRTFKVVFSKARGAMVVANEAAVSTKKKGAKTVLAVAAAVTSALSCGTAFAADEVIYTITSSQDITETVNEVRDYQEGSVPGNLHLFSISGSETVVNADNLNASITSSMPADGTTQLQTIAFNLTNGATLNLSGDSANIQVTTDTYGTNHSQTAAINLYGGSKVLVSAQETTVSVESLRKNGKAVYGVSAGEDSTITFSGETVNFIINTATDRDTAPGNINHRGEAMAIDAWDGGVVESSENTHINIQVTGTGATAVDESGQYPTGASNLYGIVAEGGSIRLNGTNQIQVNGDAGRIMAIKVTNGSYTNTGGEHQNEGAVVLGKDSTITASGNGDVYGIVAEEFELVEGDGTAQGAVALTSNGALTITVNGGEDKKAVGIDVGDNAIVNLNGETVITAKEVFTGSGTINVGNTLTANGSLGSFQGALSLEEGGLFNLTSSHEMDKSEGGKIVINGGTLQTATDLAFDADGALIADTAEEVNATTATLSDYLQAKTGTLALTDDGVYTNESLDLMSSALSSSSTVLTFLNAKLAEGQDVELKDNIVQGQEQAKATVSDGNLAVSNSGAQSIVVSAGEEADPVSNVNLTTKAGESSTTFTLVGSSEQVDLVENTNGELVDEVRVANGVTLQLGVDAEGVSSTQGKLDDLRVAAGATVKVNNIEVQVDKLVTAGTTLIGSETSRGDMSVDSLAINEGGTVFLDPAWSGNEELDTVGNASHLDIATIDRISGELIAGQNSLITIGTSSDAAASAFNRIAAVNSSMSWGQDSVTAALYVSSTISGIGDNGKIVVDGSLGGLEGYDQANYSAQVNVAEYGMLMLDMASLGNSAAVNGTLAMSDGSYIALVNADEGTIKLTESAADLTINEGDLVEVVTDNPFVQAELGSGDNAGNVIATYDGKNGLKALSSLGMQAMTRRADSVLASTIADRTSFGQNLKPGVNLWVDVRGENYQADDFDKGGEFEADMGYGTFGGDVAYGNFTFGAAFQYGTGSLRSSVSKIKNSIDNYGVSLYGTYSVTDAFKLGAELAYVWAENDISSNQTALNQSVDTEMYSVGLRAMYEMKAGNFRFVPSIGVRVSQLSTDEMKVGAVKIDDQNQTLVQIPIAMRITAADFETAGGWTLSPSFKLAYVPTFGDKEIEALHMSEDVIDTSPVQADFGLLAGKDNMLFNVNLLLGAGEYGSSAVGGKVGFKYAF